MEPEKCSCFKWIDLNEVDPAVLTIASRSNFEKYVELYGKNPPSE